MKLCWMLLVSFLSRANSTLALVRDTTPNVVSEMIASR